MRIQYGGRVARNAQHLSVMRFAEGQREAIHGSSVSRGACVLDARPAVVGGRAVALARFLRAPHRAALRAIVSGKPFPECPIFTASPIDPDSKVRSAVLGRLCDDLIEA
jgi:hypothetical protein